MRGAAMTLRSELMGLSGIVERNTYIIRRYIWWELAWFVWTLANTLTIAFIAKGFAASGAKIDVIDVAPGLVCARCGRSTAT